MVKSLVKVASGVVLGATATFALTFTGTQNLQDIKNNALEFRQEAVKTVEQMKETINQTEADNEELNNQIADLEKKIEELLANTEADAKQYVGLQKEMSKANYEINKANEEVKQTKEELEAILDTTIFEELGE